MTMATTQAVATDDTDSGIALTVRDNVDEEVASYARDILRLLAATYPQFDAHEDAAADVRQNHGFFTVRITNAPVSDRPLPETYGQWEYSSILAHADGAVDISYDRLQA